MPSFQGLADPDSGQNRFASIDVGPPFPEGREYGGQVASDFEKPTGQQVTIPWLPAPRLVGAIADAIGRLAGPFRPFAVLTESALSSDPTALCTQDRIPVSGASVLLVHA
jgi:hypothetical protein